MRTSDLTESALDLTRYDAVEIQPVSREVHENGQECLEVCDPNSPDLYCWSVYLHMCEGPVECIADCMTFNHAEFIARAITLAHPQLRQKWDSA